MGLSRRTGFVLATIAMASVGCSDAPPVADAEGGVPRDPASAPSSDAGDSASPSAEVGYRPGDEVVPQAAAARRDVFDFVVAEAERRARTEWRPPTTELPAQVGELTYVELRGIQYREDSTIWRGETPFELQLFHPGGGFDVPVGIHLIEDGGLRTLDFDPSRFLYGDEVEGLDVELPPEAGHPGFRVLHPLNEAGRIDEIVSFLGASYFRLLGPGQVYGLSTRGLAVDVAGEEGEEFPDFVDFWIEKPVAGSTALRFHALLDGPSVTGAYTFLLRPGAAGSAGFGVDRDRPTVLEVEARLFGRAEVANLGVAPLTSMYLHGTFEPGGEDDLRPRVHDSEGLLVRTGGGEWIWRPLTNREGVRVTTLFDRDPAGFGLVQRTREFDDYLDLEARYDLRPSQWVETGEGDWGTGGVRLVELPTPSEFNDNIVAYWAPNGGLAPGESKRFSYRLSTFDGQLEARPGVEGGPETGETLARIVRTRVGRDALPGEADPAPPSRRRVFLDFVGGPLSTLAAGSEVTADASTSAGVVEDLRVEKLPDGGRRVTFAIDLGEDRRADMRVLLRSTDDGRPLTETWSYLLEWTP